jgi:hypothetical protein
MVLIAETFPLVRSLTSLQMFVFHVYPCGCGLNMININKFTLRVTVYEKYYIAFVIIMRNLQITLLTKKNDAHL